MPNIPSISGKDLIKLIENLGFILARINGSHHRFTHEDGRKTTIPVHGNKDLPKGLIRKILKEDLEMKIEDFFR